MTRCSFLGLAPGWALCARNEGLSINITAFYSLSCVWPLFLSSPERHPWLLGSGRAMLSQPCAPQLSSCPSAPSLPSPPAWQQWHLTLGASIWSPSSSSGGWSSSEPRGNAGWYFPGKSYSLLLKHFCSLPLLTAAILSV